MSKARKRRIFLTAIAFILPFFILYTVFTIWPVIQGFYVSLHKWGLMGKQSFIGFDNYAKFIGDKNFWKALKATTFFVIITTPMLVILSMILAMLANRATKLKKSLRIIYYLPSVLSVAVASFIAKYVFTPYRGLVNGVLHAFYRAYCCGWGTAVAAGSESCMDYDLYYDSVVDDRFQYAFVSFRSAGYLF